MPEFSRSTQIREPEMTSVFGRLLLAVLLSSTTCASQKTYARSCDCEYIVDGKCAYTIMLPVGSGDVTSNCDVTPVAADDVSNLANNVSFLWQWVANQSRVLTELQRSVIAVQSYVISNSQSGCSTGDGATLTSLSQTLGDHAQKLNDLLVDVCNVSKVIETLKVRMTSIETTFSQARDMLLLNLTQVSSKSNQLSQRPSACANISRMFSGPNELNSSIASVNVSSSYDSSFSASGASLDRVEHPAAWCPKEPNSNEWLEFDVGIERWIFGVITKGREDYPQWVTSYNVQYHPVGGDPSIGKDNLNFWKLFTDAVDLVQTFQGNTDTSTAKINMFWKPVFTRYVRILPVTSPTNKCMRADIIGCIDL